MHALLYGSGVMDNFGTSLCFLFGLGETWPELHCIGVGVEGHTIK